MQYKLNFELVPDSCWYSNLRSILSKKQWDFIRQDAKERAGGKCMICGRKTDRLDAHERWSYNQENAVQTLEDVVAVCKSCHALIHIGLTQLRGGEENAEKHFLRVNKCTYADYRKALGEANELHQKLNQIPEWKLDLTYLKRYVKEE